MAVDIEIDVEVLKSEIKKTYASVSDEPEKDFVFPTGRSWAEDLDYPPELANVPERAVESFAGVANPFTLGRLAPGERVLDLGSGAGTDSLVAAQMVGDQGHVTGIDMTSAMLAKAGAAADEMGAANVEFVEGEVETLPFPDESFDVVISNGVIDLVPDKDAVFREIFRVLEPGGRIQIADVTIQNPVSEEGKRDIDLWTGWIAGALLEAAYAKLLERHGFERIETGQLVDTYARSKFEDTRRKAQKFGARGTTTKAYKRIWLDQASVLDPEGAHFAALERVADFAGARVLEVGCGDGRLTVPVAQRAASVFAFDPDKDAVEAARADLPAELAGRVTFATVSAAAIEIPRSAFDIVLFSWSLWWVEPEDVVHVLRRLRETLVPEGIVLDLQVIRPHPLVEVDDTVLCEIDGSSLFVGADAARAAVDLLVAEQLLEEEAIDDHDVRKHYVHGAALVADFEKSEREIPVNAIPRLQAVDRECVVRERCHARRLRRVDHAWRENPDICTLGEDPLTLWGTMRADWWPWWVSTGVALVVAGVALVVLGRSRTFRMRAAMYWLIAASLAAAVAAPFVMGADDRLTRAEYARKADANCAAFSRFAATLRPANTLPETERYMKRLLPEFRKSLEKQGDLAPPEHEERAAGQWMNAMEALGRDFEDIRAAAKQGDQAGVVTANGRSARHVDASARLSKQLGMRVCFS